MLSYVQSASIDLDQQSWPLVIELARAEETEQKFVEGIVLDEGGFAVEGASVQLAEAAATNNSPASFKAISLPSAAMSPPKPFQGIDQAILPVSNSKHFRLVSAPSFPSIP